MTAQFGERLHYDGQEMSMCTHPLGDYFALGGINPGFGQEWPLDCTALWRGYIGTWEVLGERLYLVAIHKLVLKGTETNLLETVFPGYPDRVFAHWYSGTLRIPQGNTLKYVHMGYQSTYERDMLIDVERGVIGDVRIRENEIPKEVETPTLWG
jgi:hypothetical protein